MQQQIQKSTSFFKNQESGQRQGALQNENDSAENDQADENPEWKSKNKQSSASCHVDNIYGLIFGGLSSRFWMLRKHINSLDSDSIKKLPFYCWNCITLVMKHRYVDLVIKNEDDMNILLKFLIYTLKTADGNRNSAPPIIEALNCQKINEYKTQFNKESISKKKEIEIIRFNEYNVYKKVLFKYKIMKVR